MAIKPRYFCRSSDGGFRCGGRASTAWSGHSAGPTAPHRLRAPPIARRCNHCRISGTVAPEGTTTGQRAEPLGDRLARSDGVLCPPPASIPKCTRRRPMAAKCGDSARPAAPAATLDSAQIAPFAGLFEQSGFA